MLVGFSRSQNLRAYNHIVTIQVQQGGFTSVESLKAGGFTIRATVPKKNKWLAPHLSLTKPKTETFETRHTLTNQRENSRINHLCRSKCPKIWEKVAKGSPISILRFFKEGVFKWGRSPIFLIVSLSSQRFLVRNPKFHSYPFPLNTPFFLGL